MNQEQSDRLLQLTREVLDLKMEKKSTNKDFNDRIKALEVQIAECVKE